MPETDEHPRLMICNTAASAPESFLLEGLFNILDSEKALCGNLADVMEQEHQAILAADAGALESVCDQKFSMIEDICRLDRQREHVVRQIKKIIGVHGRTPSLRQLADLMPREHSESLRIRAAELSDTVCRVARVTHQTRKLLNNARDLTDGLRSILTGAATSTATYRKSGKLSPVESAGRLMSGTI